MNTDMLRKVREDNGFIAALDQSGGSTPKALRLYGVTEDQYSGDEEMFNKVHEMRTRIVASPSFTGEHILGAILFEMTMDREFEGAPAAKYLWESKQVVPFLKVDKGLADEANGVQLMKPIPGLDDLLDRAKAHGIFGTKMRSVIKSANEAGIADIVDQQFEIGKQIIGHGLVPIIEPEVDITAADKAQSEDILKARIAEHLDGLGEDDHVMLKLSLPTSSGLYTDFVKHPRVDRVVALSGGYSRDDANDKLAQNAGVIASFSRALTEGLSDGQSDEEFNKTLAEAIQAIYAASIA